MYIPNISVLNVDHEFLHKINQIAYDFGFLDGINYQITSSEKNNNQIANIYAIALKKLPHIKIEQIEDVFFNRNSGCISKELSAIKSIVDAYLYIADATKTHEAAFQVFLVLNKILNTEMTPYTNIGYNNMQSWQMNELKNIFEATIEPYLSEQKTNRYILAAEVFHSYYSGNRFTEFSQLPWLFLALYIIFPMDTLLPDMPLKGLVATMIEKKADYLQTFVISVLDEIYNTAHELRYMLHKKRIDCIPDFTTGPMQRLLAVMVDNRPMSSRELMAKLKLTDMSSFRKRYLTPAVKSGLVERSLPDHPSSPAQTYILAANGRAFLQTSDIRSGQRPVHKKA